MKIGEVWYLARGPKVTIQQLTKYYATVSLPDYPRVIIKVRRDTLQRRALEENDSTRNADSDR